MTQNESQSRPAPLAVHDLRRMPGGPETGDGFLGQVLDASHHPQWEFWRSAGGGRSGRFDSAARHLVVIVLDGGLSLRADQTETRLGPGDSALVAPGTGFDWQSSGEALWIVNGYRDAAAESAAAPGIAQIDRDAAQGPSAPPAESLLVGPAPRCSKRALAGSGDQCWSAGLWSATPYQRIPVRYGYYEMMHLHAGAVTVFDETGTTMTFRKGDLFLVPEGVTAGWRSTGDVRKLFSIFTPATP